MAAVFFEALCSASGIALLGIACSLFGFIVGHKLNLWRDKRQHFNDALCPVRAAFIKSSGQPCCVGWMPDSIEIDALEMRMKGWHRRRFRAALACYKETCSKNYSQDAVGGSIYANAPEICAALDRLIRLTRCR